MHLQINRNSFESISFSKKRSEFYFEYENYRLLIDSPKTESELFEKNSILIEFIQKVVANSLSDDWMIDFVGGHYAIILWNINNLSTWVFRDIAGAKTVYYYTDRDVINVGNCLFDFKVQRTLNIAGLRRKKIFGYTIDGETIFDSISEVKMGHVMTFDESNKPLVLYDFGLKLSKQDSLFSTEKSIELLRYNIIRAHENVASNSNIVLLSGGIDSSVMLAALNEIKTSHMDVCAVTFKLKGTSEDETPFAKEVAKRFGTEIETIEVDPNSMSIVDKFQSDVVQMNSPYHGALIYGNLSAGKDSAYFAGQDTRLHTPDLNWLDCLFFDFIEMNKFEGLLSNAKNKSLFFNNTLSTLSKSKYRNLRGLARLAYFNDARKYVFKYMLGIDESLSEITQNEFDDNLALFEQKIISQRDLYNRITAFRWGTQFTSDMRYLQDMARINETNMCLPFYDISLARFSSGLPFKTATAFTKGTSSFDSKKVDKVNKFFLREAFKADLPLNLASRQKAVSRTLYLLFNGPLCQVVREIINRDIRKKNDSISSVLGYSKVIHWFMHQRQFVPEDEKLLTEIFQLACILETACEI